MQPTMDGRMERRKEGWKEAMTNVIVLTCNQLWMDGRMERRKEGSHD